jgi:ribosome-binding protein aMBF1 (putative translation factor)
LDEIAFDFLKDANRSEIRADLFVLLTIVGASRYCGLIILQTMNIQEKFGLRVRRLRELKSYSIEQLANIAEMDRNYLSGIERGSRNCSIEIQERILKALEIEFKEFYDDEIFAK